MATLIRPAGCFTFLLDDDEEVLGDNSDLAEAWDNKSAPGILTFFVEGDTHGGAAHTHAYITPPGFLAETARHIDGSGPYAYGPIAFDDLSELAVYSDQTVTVYVCVDIVRSEGK